MKKLYIVTNNKVANKGKLARACATIGAHNPHLTIASPTIVVKGADDFNELFYNIGNDSALSGVHMDAGHTQVEAGTILAFGVISGTSNFDKVLEELKLL